MSLKINIIITFSVITISILAYYLVTKSREIKAKDEIIKCMMKELAVSERIIRGSDESESEDENSESGSEEDESDSDEDHNSNSFVITAVEEVGSECGSVQDVGDTMVIDQE